MTPQPFGSAVKQNKAARLKLGESRLLPQPGEAGRSSATLRNTGEGGLMDLLLPRRRSRPSPLNRREH